MNGLLEHASLQLWYTAATTVIISAPRGALSVSEEAN